MLVKKKTSFSMTVRSSTNQIPNIAITFHKSSTEIVHKALPYADLHFMNYVWSIVY